MILWSLHEIQIIAFFRNGLKVFSSRGTKKNQTTKKSFLPHTWILNSKQKSVMSRSFSGWIGVMRFQQMCFAWTPWRISLSCGWQGGLEVRESERWGSHVLVAVLCWQPVCRVQGPAPGDVAPGRPPFVMAHLVPGSSPKCDSCTILLNWNKCSIHLFIFGL